MCFSLQFNLDDPVCFFHQNVICPNLRFHLMIMKSENTGENSVSELLLVFPDCQAQNLAYLFRVFSPGKGKAKFSLLTLHIKAVKLEGVPTSLIGYSVLLPEPLGKGENFNLDVLTVYTHSLKPFPAKIIQADIQLLVFEDSTYYLSPYDVKAQSLLNCLKPELNRTRDGRT